MTTYFLINGAKKYDATIKKIKTAAKQTRAKIVSMTDELQLIRETEEIYRDNGYKYPGKDHNLAGVMNRIKGKRLVTKIVLA